MSNSYLNIERQVATHLNALSGSTPLAAETNYLATLTITNYADAYFPQGVIRDTILDTEMVIINAICNNGYHPLRNLFISNSSSLANGTTLPGNDTASRRFVGILSNVKDVTTGLVLTPAPLRKVQQRTSNENSMWSVPVYHYAIDGAKIYHTVTNVNIEFAGAARGTFTGNIQIGDDQVRALVSGTLSTLCSKEGALMDMAAYHKAIFDGEIEKIRTFGLPATVVRIPEATPSFK